MRPSLPVVLASVMLSCAMAAPAVSALTVPRGFMVTASAPGVTLYHKRRDYVQAVDPSKSARIRILHGPVLPTGDYATFPRLGIRDWWTQWSAETPGAFSVVNGQFFDPSDSSVAPLAFSIKTDGKVYEGYGDRNEYPMQKRFLALYDDRAVISDYDDDPETLRRIPAKDILVGLSTRASKSLSRALPRTFIAVTPQGEVLVLSSSMASQKYANRLLRAFGADPDQIMMLDGGSSSHLVQGANVLVPVDGRGKTEAARERLPQVVGVEAGPQ